MGAKLFVGNLSWDTTEASLTEFFSQAGEVLEAKIIMDRMTGKSRGFAFVTMADAEGAEKAKTELNGKELDGREIKVDEARESRSEQ